MKYLQTFETFTSAPLPKAALIQNEKEVGDSDLRENDVDKEISKEEKEELEKEEATDKKKTVA